MTQVSKPSVCLQINLAASDLRCLPHTLPHQMRVFADQVSEIQFTLDTGEQRNTKYRLDRFEGMLSAVRGQLSDICAIIPHAYTSEIDFSIATVRKISNELRIKDGIPTYAVNGSPFYGYLYGLYNAKSDFVLHLDADMLFGGGSQSWINEAVNALRANPRLLAVNPLAGPPTRDGTIKQDYVERLDVPYQAFTFDQISTRVFLAERRRILFDYELPILPVHGERRLRALVNSMPAVYELELCFSAMMMRERLVRLDMLGTNSGLWSLHPPYRSETFYERLPDLIKQIEAGNITEGQRGDYDINDSTIDWSDARRGKVANRISRYFNFAKNGIFHKALR